MKDGTKIIVTQTRSVAGRTDRTRDTLKALGLGRIGKSKEHKTNAAIMGMLRAVEHLVEVKEAR